MRILIVEDDFVSRRLLQKMLSQLGICDTAVNGTEAVKAFQMAHDEGSPYDLVCLDIMMPEMDGLEVLKRIRLYEKGIGIEGLSGVKIIMITALDDFNNIKTSFREQCEAYVIKPIEREKLLHVLKILNIPVSAL